MTNLESKLKFSKSSKHFLQKNPYFLHALPKGYMLGDLPPTTTGAAASSWPC